MRCVVLRIQESGSQAQEAWARKHPWFSGLIGAGIVLAGINFFHVFGPIHLHNDGPLGALSGAGFAFDSSTSGPWTAGYELCLQPGADQVIIESIAPASEVGAGLKYLGAYVREIVPDTSTTTNTGGIDTGSGFPPTVTQTLHPVRGYRVTHECSWEESQPPSSQGPYTELDVGVGRRSLSEDGGWTGFTVTYVEDLTQYVATWDTELYACGTGPPTVAMCAPPN
jgi:hypothetical protein